MLNYNLLYFLLVSLKRSKRQDLEAALFDVGLWGFWLAAGEKEKILGLLMYGIFFCKSFVLC